MPGLDRSGPRGAGPMTGGSRGVCGSPSDWPYNGFGIGQGRGFGAGRGFGRRCGRGFGPAYGAHTRPWVLDRRASLNETDELETLRIQADSLRKSLDAVHDRLSELETHASDQE